MDQSIELIERFDEHPSPDVVAQHLLLADAELLPFEHRLFDLLLALRDLLLLSHFGQLQTAVHRECGDLHFLV